MERLAKTSQFAIKRLSDYLTILRSIAYEGRKIISSSELASMMNITDAQVRKDLSQFMSIGKRGVGYKLDELIDEIEKVMDLKRVHNVYLIGLGRLGNALLDYRCLRGSVFEFSAVFDNDPQKVGRKAKGIQVRHIDDLPKVNKTLKCDIALLTIPADAVAGVFEMILKTQIRAVLNFTPVILRGNEKLVVKNIDIVSDFNQISYYLKEMNDDNKIKR